MRKQKVGPKGDAAWHVEEKEKVIRAMQTHIENLISSLLMKCMAVCRAAGQGGACVCVSMCVFMLIEG